MTTPESRYYHITQPGKINRKESLAETLAAVKEGGFIWLDYCQPARADLEVLIAPLGLHPLSIEDCFDENQIPKVEDYPTNTFVLFNAIHYAGQALSVREVDIFFGANFVVTVNRCDGPLLQRPAEGPLLQNPEKGGLPQGGNRTAPLDIDQLLEMRSTTALQGPDFLAHAIMDGIVDQKFVAIEALEEELDGVEDVILTDHTGFVPGDLVRLRRDLLALRKSLFHEREILVKLCRRDSPFISEKSIFLYRDVYDHLAKFFELTESARDLVSGLMEMYLSIINNQMTRAANETNITVRRLTFITTIFMPLTLLAGIGGMSEWSMMTGPGNWWWSYPLFCLGLAAVGVLTYAFFRRKRWV
jgi:magnesium transporter